MFDFYEKSICTKKETSMPFKTFIDDVCYKKNKKVNIFSSGKKEVKERSYTYTPNFDVPLENWRNRKSIDSTILNNNNNCKKLEKNKMNDYNKKIQTNN